MVRATGADRRRPPALRRGAPASLAGDRPGPPYAERAGARADLGGQPLRLLDAGHGPDPARSRPPPAGDGRGADAGRDRARPGARTSRGGAVVRAGLLRQTAARPRRRRALAATVPS